MTFPGYCPACDARIRFSAKPFIGQRLTCPECEHLVEVIRLEPLKLDWVWEESRDEPVRITASFDSADSGFVWTDVDNE
jgi:lysine biosynthesis protein LysW